MYLLDTDTYSNFLKGDRRIVRRVSDISFVDIYLCAITAEEMLKGWLAAINTARTKRSVSVPEAYDELLDLIRQLNKMKILRYDDDAERLFQSWPQSYKQLGSQDARIAAVAYVNDLIVVTCNTRHFDKIAEVRNEDWSV